MTQALVTGLNGLSYAFILFLLAAGFSLTFGVMGVLNLAHGTLFVFGAYIGLQALASLGGGYGLAILLAAASLALVGYVLYVFALRRLHGKAPEQGVLTLGFGMIITNAILWIWGPMSKIAQPPAFLRGSLKIGELSFPMYRVGIVVVGLVILAALWWVQDRTRWGAVIRAGMDNKEMTVGLGINYALVSTIVFLLGVAIAGAGGVIAAPVLGVFPNQGDNFLLLTLIVVVVGGTGYIQGTMLGALLIGLLDTYGKAYVPSAALFFSYILFIVILLVRPSGLIGRKVF